MRQLPADKDKTSFVEIKKSNCLLNQRGVIKLFEYRPSQIDLPCAGLVFHTGLPTTKSGAVQ